ncbi:MAG: RNA-binding protein [Candidatus Krumholzibacteria bacterium]|jgi:RNA recognition motif-containing protein|nr:RNA-binding protein [Candidatus Krumholzibacteria bacterium]
MAKNIYVGNLPFSTTDDDLNQLFSPYGSVSSARIIKDKFTDRSRGFGFVEMDNDDEADKAIEATNGKEVDGRALKVSEARPREEKRGGRGGGGGGYGRDSY